MRLPHRDPIQLGSTPYEAFQAKEGIPSVDLVSGDGDWKEYTKTLESEARAKS